MKKSLNRADTVGDAETESSLVLTGAEAESGQVLAGAVYKSSPILAGAVTNWPVSGCLLL